MSDARPLHVFLVAGEESGDQLGAGLMAALREMQPDVRFSGVGGARMTGQGLTSIFPLSDIAVMGISAVIPKLPTIIRRVHATVDVVLAAQPDVLVIIDSPDFTHAVAKRVRKRAPKLPIVDYVSPSVWAWRPGRARKMRAYVDHLLALLPFEPAAHERLGGPPTTYVGHPLIEKLDLMQPAPGERPELGADLPTLLVLPGSRHSEIKRLLQPFGETLRLVAERAGPFRLILPAVEHVRAEIEAGIADWPVKPDIVRGEAAKFAAFRQAHAALAASGTVTLELALASVPMVVSYRVSLLEIQLRRFITVPSFVLPNLILGKNAIPELMQEECQPLKLADALTPLLTDTAERRAQIAALARLDTLMATGDETPSQRAARIVIETAQAGVRP
jgi:lipid-A-disaccharide synthase